jgi:hypothetical protein
MNPMISTEDIGTLKGMSLRYPSTIATKKSAGIVAITIKFAKQKVELFEDGIIFPKS